LGKWHGDLPASHRGASAGLRANRDFEKQMGALPR
jgi:hypothetical protein